MQFDYEKIPSEMKQLNRWVLWKTKTLDNGRTTKVPIDARNGYGARSNDTSTWVSFDQAIEKCDYYGCKGLGFMLGSGYFGIDLDNHGEISQEDFDKLAEEFTTAISSYAEISQSGKGIHIICKGVLPQGSRRRKGNIEMYDNARFFALTGNIYKDHDTIIDGTDLVKPLYEKYLTEPKVSPSAYVYKSENKSTPILMSPSSLSDSEVLQKATESKNGNLFTSLYYGQWEGLYPSQSEADLALCSLLAFWCGKDTFQMDRIFRSSKLYRDKWDEMRGSDTYGNIQLRMAVSQCRDVYTPAFMPKSDVYDVKSGGVKKTKNYDLNDTGNAERFVDRFGENVRYNFDNKYWVIWNGKTWIKDTKQIVKTQADVMIEEMKREAFKIEDKDLQREVLKNIKHLSSNSGKEAMLKEAMHIGSIPTSNADYNKDIYLLNCSNGVVDLRTGKILPHNKAYMMSKNTNTHCDMTNEPKRWLQFLNEVFDNNQSLVDYVQEAVGYTLTGSVQEQCMFQCYGDGANGKSVFLDVIYNLMGDYALNAQIEAFLAKGNNNSGGASSEIARMNGARCVRTNEPNEGSRFNEGLVKQMVGGDITTARYLYGQDFEFKPCFKLWIATNYKINVRGTDGGIWRRQRLIPFLMKFDGDKADKRLTSKLLAELPQIFGWAVKGAIKWYASGLEVPKIVEEANKEYKAEMDIVASFLKDNVRETPAGKTKAGDVYKAYSTWARDGHEYCMTQTKFGMEMSKRYEKKCIAGYTYYIGFTLKEKDKGYIYTKEE